MNNFRDEFYFLVSMITTNLVGSRCDYRNNKNKLPLKLTYKWNTYEYNLSVSVRKK